MVAERSFTMKKLGQDFENFMQEAKQIPEVEDYLTSFSVMIGDMVLARRTKLGWSQAKLASLASTTQARISQIEAGSQSVKLDTINRVVHALGLKSVSPFYGEDAASKEVVY